MTVIEEIAAERRRQIEVEGWVPEHDDAHDSGQLAMAAVCYARFSTGRRIHRLGSCPLDWPWDIEWWKPKCPRRDLIRAAALIVAEIERLDRAATTTGETA
jgi:hypothetical protein